MKKINKEEISAYPRIWGQGGLHYDFEKMIKKRIKLKKSIQFLMFGNCILLILNLLNFITQILNHNLEQATVRIILIDILLELNILLNEMRKYK